MTKKKYVVYVYHKYYERHEVFAEDETEASMIFDASTLTNEKTLEYSVDVEEDSI